MAGRAALITGFLLAVFLHHAAADEVHVVGDLIGWKVPQGGASFYSDWASRNQFKVGDSLLFKFEKKKHRVVEVSKESFEKCSSDNVIGDVITEGPVKVDITSAGEHYYICTKGNHCEKGQKLAITVSAAGGSRPAKSSGAAPATFLGFVPQLLLALYIHLNF